MPPTAQVTADVHQPPASAVDPPPAGSAQAVAITAALAPAPGTLVAGVNSDMNAILVVGLLIFVAIPMVIVMALIATVLTRR